MLVNSRENRVVEGTVEVSYGDDPVRGIEVVTAALTAEPGVVADPAVQVGIQSFGESGIELSYRYWVPTTAFFEVQYRVNLAVWTGLRDAGLTIPVPQRDVHIRDA